MAQTEGEIVSDPAPAIAPGLYIVATPIGNLGDITLRALEVLRAVDLVACEDSRVTGHLLAHFDIKIPLTVYREHNAARMRPRILARLAEGARVALVSDAGTPLVSDPGAKLVAAAHAAGHAVHPIPGPSAMLAALTAAGLPTDRVLFLGFPPAKSAARRRFLLPCRDLVATLVLYEAPHRLADSLADLAAVFGNREAAVCREMTKLYEEIRRGRLGDLAGHYANRPPKGEIVLVIAPPRPDAPSDAAIDDALRSALATMSVREAAREVAKATGARRTAVYARALALKEQGEGDG